jgi:hypothetical protein
METTLTKEILEQKELKALRAAVLCWSAQVKNRNLSTIERAALLGKIINAETRIDEILYPITPCSMIEEAEYATLYV